MRWLWLVVFPTVALANELNFEQLANLIENKPNIEAALAALPQSFRENYSLLPNSRSGHPGTPAAPRAIFYNPSGNLMVSFNGASDTFEIVRFNPQSGRNEFFSGIVREGRLRIENGTSCTRCHGEPPRLRWDHERQYLSSGYQRPIPDGEQEAFARFRAEASKHPRYRFLSGLGDYDETQFPRGRNDGNLRSESFRRMLDKAQGRTILAQLKKNPRFTEFEPLLWAILQDCDALAMLPETTRRSYATLFPNPQASEAERRELAHLFGPDDIQRTFSKNGNETIVRRLVNMRLLSALRGTVGLNTESWSMQTENGLPSRHLPKAQWDISAKAAMFYDNAFEVVYEQVSAHLPGDEDSRSCEALAPQVNARIGDLRLRQTVSGTVPHAAPIAQPNH